ncbi:Hypothetical predicted protein [Mytilus galloprovincialis]|uniref:Uncharacterized protein n=1 Tax=Mytilus galloprovincialis TaxID=29158 RepID=A0A8B6BJC3_MYTGA|nr:Hypothetical predicted protein [Mytilus galloprovincialis]VDH91405.1 Hypothetical predicted protein [Mytilus galloprovincialis]
MEDRKDFMLVTLPSMSIWVDTYKNSEITMNIIPRWEDGNVTYLSVTPPVGEEETKLMACQIGDYQFADNVIIEKPKRVVYFLPTEPTLPDTRINCPNTKGNILQTLSSVKSMKLENLKHNDIQKEVERSTMTTVHWSIIVDCPTELCNEPADYSPCTSSCDEDEGEGEDEDDADEDDDENSEKEADAKKEEAGGGHGGHAAGAGAAAEVEVEEKEYSDDEEDSCHCICEDEDYVDEDPDIVY